MAQNRIFWAVQAIGMKDVGDTGGYTALHGAQTLGLTTTFNLSQIFEIGQIEIYENIEEIPDIEISVEKVLDAYPLAYHLATPNSPASTLAGRSNSTCIMAVSIFPDTYNSASGTPLTTVEMSGLFVSSLSYSATVDGGATENMSLVGNNKAWSAGGSTIYGTAFDGTIFDNLDEPLNITDSGGVQQREDVIFQGSDLITLLPTDIPGISSSGTNNLRTDGTANLVPVQSITISADLGRDSLFELGRRGPYHRFVDFPVEVTTEIEVNSLSGDMVDAYEEQVNLSDQQIKLVMREGTVVNTGTRNKLSNVTYGGADTGGGNATVTYSYTGFNNMTVTHPQDPG